MQTAPNFRFFVPKLGSGELPELRRVSRGIGCLLAATGTGLNGFFYAWVAEARLARASQFARWIQVRGRGCRLEISTVGFTSEVVAPKVGAAQMRYEESRWSQLINLCLPLDDPVGSP